MRRGDQCDTSGVQPYVQKFFRIKNDSRTRGQSSFSKLPIQIRVENTRSPRGSK